MSGGVAEIIVVTVCLKILVCWFVVVCVCVWGGGGGEDLGFSNVGPV